MKLEWKDVIDTFSEERRHYNGKYLEKDLVLNNEVELSYFSKPDGECEIYFNFGRMVGVVYVTPEEYEDTYEKMKKDIEEEYERVDGNTDDIPSDFVNSFVGKYKVCLPYDLFSSFTIDDFIRAWEQAEKDNPFPID